MLIVPCYGCVTCYRCKTKTGHSNGAIHQKNKKNPGGGMQQWRCSSWQLLITLLLPRGIATTAASPPMPQNDCCIFFFRHSIAVPPQQKCCHQHKKTATIATSLFLFLGQNVATETHLALSKMPPCEEKCHGTMKNATT